MPFVVGKTETPTANPASLHDGLELHSIIAASDTNQTLCRRNGNVAQEKYGSWRCVRTRLSSRVLPIQPNIGRVDKKIDDVNTSYNPDLSLSLPSCSSICLHPLPSPLFQPNDFSRPPIPQGGSRYINDRIHALSPTLPQLPQRFIDRFTCSKHRPKAVAQLAAWIRNDGACYIRLVSLYSILLLLLHHRLNCLDAPHDAGFSRSTEATLSPNFQPQPFHDSNSNERPYDYTRTISTTQTHLHQRFSTIKVCFRLLLFLFHFFYQQGWYTCAFWQFTTHFCKHRRRELLLCTIRGWDGGFGKGGAPGP